MTATTPIWGKLADLFSKKLLVQCALVIFSIGSLIAAFAPNMEVLIGARVVQGLGVGGLTALVQVVIASMVSPRERGRYSGYIGATFALATVVRTAPRRRDRRLPAGLARLLLRRPPVAVAAFVVLQTRAAPARWSSATVHIDYLGATLIVAGVSSSSSGSRSPAPVRLGLRHHRAHGRRRPRASSPRRCTSRRGSPRAGDPAPAVQGPHHVARDGRLGDDRRLDVRRDGLPQPSTSSSPAA